MFSLATSCTRRAIAEQSCGDVAVEMLARKTTREGKKKKVRLHTKAYDWEKQTKPPPPPKKKPQTQPLAAYFALFCCHGGCVRRALQLTPSSASAVTHIHTAPYCSRGEKAINVPPLIYNISVCWTCPVSVVLCLLRPRVRPHAFTQTPTHAQSM